MHVRVRAFQPFSSRVGLDTVAGLEFAYDRDLIAVLKEGIRDARRWFGRPNLGGWLPEHRKWFVEWIAWPTVKDHLERAGHTVEDAGAGEHRERARHANGHSQARPPLDVKAAVSRWFRELSREFHPDRGGHPERMIALNLAHEKLREVLRL
jgi:hypothetical protein